MRVMKLMGCFVVALLMVSVCACEREDESFSNSVGMRFVRIPPGTFVMGSPDAGDPDGRFDEGPAHRVRITKAFWMSAYEVTQEQYERVIGRNPSHYRGDPGLPVELVTWFDAAEFCEKLARKEGKRYRLPTEAEWEYACRAGTSSRWFFGDSPEKLGDYAWFGIRDDRPIQEQHTFRVGQKKPNPWGLYDILGNVSEWCSDSTDYTDRLKGSPRLLYLRAYRAEDNLDPRGADKGELRIMRGGSFDFPDSACRCAERSAMEPELRMQITGFRVVCEVE